MAIRSLLIRPLRKRRSRWLLLLRLYLRQLECQERRLFLIHYTTTTTVIILRHQLSFQQLATLPDGPRQYDEIISLAQPDRPQLITMSRLVMDIQIMADRTITATQVDLTIMHTAEGGTIRMTMTRIIITRIHEADTALAEEGDSMFE